MHVRKVSQQSLLQVQAALKSKGLRDDITVLVIDAMPDDSCRLPPHLAKPNGGHAPSVEEIGSVDWHKPLNGAAVAEICASNTWWAFAPPVWFDTAWDLAAVGGCLIPSPFIYFQLSRVLRLQSHACPEGSTVLPTSGLQAACHIVPQQGKLRWTSHLAISDCLAAMIDLLHLRHQALCKSCLLFAMQTCIQALHSLRPADSSIGSTNSCLAPDQCWSACRQRRIAAVQAEFGLPGHSSNGSSDTNVDDVQLDQSYMAGDSSACSTPFVSPEAFLEGSLLEEDSADWETVPVKPKREAAALSSASAPPSATDALDGWAESPAAEDTAGQWEIPHKHTKLGSYQPNSSPATANGIKAMRDSQKQRRSDSATGIADEGRQQRGERGRGRSQSRGRGRGRGRNYSKGHRSQHEQAPQVQGHDPLSATDQHSSPSPEADVASSWGADTVFPMTPSPVDSPLLSSAGAAASVPRVLTIPRPPQSKNVTTAGGGQGHPNQQQSRGRRDNRTRGGNNGRGGRGRQSAPADRVQSCPVYDISDQPACQQISFGNFGAEFGSTMQGSTTNPAAANNGTSSSGSHVYQQQQEHVSRQQPQGGVHRGRGRGRFTTRGRFARNKTDRQDNNQNNSAAVA